MITTFALQLGLLPNGYCINAIIKCTAPFKDTDNEKLTRSTAVNIIKKEIACTNLL